MQKTLSVSGMTCNKCVAHVKMALEELAGVTDAQVSLQDQNAVVTMDQDIDNQVLKEAVEEFGYQVKDIQ